MALTVGFCCPVVRPGLSVLRRVRGSVSACTYTTVKEHLLIEYRGCKAWNMDAVHYKVAVFGSCMMLGMLPVIIWYLG